MAVAQAELPQPGRRLRAMVGNVPVDSFTMADAVRWVMSELAQQTRTPLLIMGPNAQLINLAADNSAFADALRAADLCVPDGISMVWAARLLGTPVSQRVPGGELMEALCSACAVQHRSVFFLGGLPGAADMAAAKLQLRLPGMRIAGCYCPPMAFEQDPRELERIERLITAARPDLLCVAFGAPRQEIWMHRYCPSLPIGAAISVGAALDTCAGLRRRAPRWTHRLGLEWLYRFVREPRRLWRRYLLGNPRFAFIVFVQLWKRRFPPHVSPPAPV